MIHPHDFDFWTWLGHFTGVSDESGPGYGFFSGIGSDISEVVLVGAAYKLLRQRNCHQKSCWRFGLHQVGDSPYRTCRRHHPDLMGKPRNVTSEHLRHHHEDWLRRSRLGEPETPVAVVEESGRAPS